ncbi:aromatic amino acid lyase [Radicibacter daui]|uniref:aromatic amino acid lyase n=1 Tax=Radicibacter daui TaxID=3064829 RepID=UPI00404693F8
MTLPIHLLDGAPIPLPLLLDIGRGARAVAACPVAMERVAEARKVVDAAVEHGDIAYGITTGVGALKERIVAEDTFGAFSRALKRAHHFGAGPALPPLVVRMALAIRTNTALTGHAGCSPEFVAACIAMLASPVVPVVRSMGSIGCADIGLMAQIGSVLAGEGEAFYGEERMSAAEALERAGLTALDMKPKDAMVSLSSNATALASGIKALSGAALQVRAMLTTAAATAAGHGCSPAPWQAAIMGSPAEAEVGAALVAAYNSGGWPQATRVQDPLSFRMLAQVFGSVLEVLASGLRTLERATARCDDNPAVLDGALYTHGGSLPLDVALVLQSAAAAIAHVARNSLSRLVLLANGRHAGLPMNLVDPTSGATGFGPLLKLAGDCYARVMAETMPVSALAITVSDGIEDEGSLAPLLAERLETQTQALTMMMALEGLFAAQALDLRGAVPQGAAGLVRARVRLIAAQTTEDRSLSSELEALAVDFSNQAGTGPLLAATALPLLDQALGLAAVPPLELAAQ